MFLLEKMPKDTAETINEPMGGCGMGRKGLIGSDPMWVWHGRGYLWYVSGCGAGLQ